MSHLVLHIITIVIMVGFTQCTTRQVSSEFTISTNLLQEGDIAFRRGEGITSDIVAYNDADGKYSHVGVVAKIDSCFVIVHSVPGEGTEGQDIVRAVALNDFFATDKAIKGEIMRIALDSLQQQVISKRAIEKARLQVEFDHQYNLDDTTKLYCTELLQLLFGHIGIDLAQGRTTHINVPGMTGDYIMPSDIHQNSNLESIVIF